MNSLPSTSASFDLTQWVLKFKVPFISAVALILVLVLGVGIYHYYQEHQQDKYAEMIYQFEQNDWKKLQEAKPELSPGKIEITAFSEQFRKLAQQVKHSVVLIPLVLKIADTFLEKQQYQESKEFLDYAANKLVGKNVYTNYFIRSRLAVVNENLGDYAGAISQLEKLNQQQSKILEAKTYLDLGRLYLLTKQMEQAKTSFEYLVEKFADDEYGKLAKIYLQQLREKE